MTDIGEITFILLAVFFVWHCRLVKGQPAQQSGGGRLHGPQWCQNAGY